MPPKIRLNDHQWNELVKLARTAGKMVKLESPPSARLISNGFIAINDAGKGCLTERGAERINQGR